MRVIRPGEGPRFFPSFFFFFLLFFVSFASPSFLPSSAAAQKSDSALSRFDRLAEEATALNRRKQFDRVISLLTPYRNDSKNDSALFFNELGVAYLNKENFGEALRAFQSALRLDPENAVVRNNLGDALRGNQEYSRAVEEYRKVLQSNPRFYQAHAGLGIAYYHLHQYKEALTEFDTVLKLNPRDDEARQNREAVLKKVGERK